MIPIKLRMGFEKSTKNTHKYSVQHTAMGKPACSEVYIQKVALADNPPETIVVTIERA